jgi:hypothetical protein
MTAYELVERLYTQYLTEGLAEREHDKAAFGLRKRKVEQEIRQGTRRSKGKLPV